MKTNEIETLKELIKRTYLNGAANKMNTKALQEGYHQDFAIFFAEGNELKRLPLQNWVNIIEEYKASHQVDSGLRKLEGEFIDVDITGNAAAVKLELRRQGELIFTDYITLLKFPNGWKIVTKIYHAHVDRPWG